MTPGSPSTRSAELPGVCSARYAGEAAGDDANNRKLLADLAGSPDRSARFVCALALVLPGGVLVTAEGELPGRIVAEPRGARGFGYDPLFQPDGCSGHGRGDGGRAEGCGVASGAGGRGVAGKTDRSGAGGVNREVFERLVAEALDGLPEELRAHMENVEVMIEEWPSALDLADAGMEKNERDVAAGPLLRRPPDRARHRVRGVPARSHHAVPRPDPAGGGQRR